MNKFVLGVDPSGSFDEGKGTTGWCIYDASAGAVVEIGSISAHGYNTALDYWNAHVDLVLCKQKQYGESALVVSMEDFLLYKSQSSNLINSRMETSQLIGILKHLCYTKHIPCCIRAAVIAKKRWTNEILIHKGILTRKHVHHYAACTAGRILSDHEIDSIRHALHCAYFEIKEDSHAV